MANFLRQESNIFTIILTFYFESIILFEGRLGLAVFVQCRVFIVASDCDVLFGLLSQVVRSSLWPFRERVLGSVVL